MANNGLPNVNSNDETTSSLSNFLGELNAAWQDEYRTVEDINKLKIENVKNLGKLQADQEYLLVERYSQLKAEAAAKQNEADQRALEERFELMNQHAAEMSEEQFKREYGFDKKRLAAQQKQEQKNLELTKKYREKQATKEAKQAAKEAKRKETSEKVKAARELSKTLTSKDATAAERMAALKGMAGRIGTKEFIDADGNVQKRSASVSEKISGTIGAVANVLSDMAKQLDNTINTIAGYKSKIDTRLQGLNRSTGGNTWDDISKNITGFAGVSPFIKQSAVAERVSQMVSQGIAFNVEQRAALDVMKEKIATTFDAANGTLLRLVRIQQQDTTAGRLGMESALTAFLNNMYETTEYMGQIADSIKGNLEEAMSLMTGENALSFEYQVQKWLGSLYSVGMSNNAVQGFGSVLGKIAAGQLDGITNGGQGNLVIMAANQAGLNISDILNNGLNSQTTNQLMSAAVDYLAKLYQDAGDSKVIQQQLASVYGMTAADLRAAANLARSNSAISRSGLSYGDAVNRLYSMAGSMHKRTSLGEMMTNMWDNVQYSMAAGIGNNPALYALYKAAGLLDTVAGGINIPAFSVMGNMVDLETTVANLMRAGAMGGGILSSIGTMISAGGGGGITGKGILDALKVGNGISRVSRGSSVSLSTSGGLSYSESGAMIGNTASNDIQNKTMTDANDSSQAQLAEAVETTDETKLSEVYTEVVNIYNLLQEVANGNYTISVNVSNLPENTSAGLGY